MFTDSLVGLWIKHLIRCINSESNIYDPSTIVGVGGAMGDATTVDMKAWDRDLRINVTSMVLMCRFAVPEMRKTGRGAIVNLSSVSGRKLKSSSPTINENFDIDVSISYGSHGWQPKSSLCHHKRCHHSNDASHGFSLWTRPDSSQLRCSWHGVYTNGSWTRDE